MNEDGFCRYWAEGRCRFGDRCHYPHGDRPGGNQGDNRAGNGGGGGGGRGAYRSGGRGGKYAGRNQNTFQDVPPQWPLTAIGNENSLEGNLLSDEISPEELRVHAYSSAPRGQSQEVIRREAQLVREHQGKSSRVRGESTPIEAGDPFAMGNGGGGGGNGLMRDIQPNDPFASGSNAGGAFGLENTSTAMSFGSSAGVGGVGAFGGQATSAMSNGTTALPFGSQPLQQQPSSTFSNGFGGAQPTTSFGAQQPPSAFGNGNGAAQPSFGNGLTAPQQFGSTQTGAPAPTFGGTAGAVQSTPAPAAAPAPTPAVPSMVEPPKQEVNLAERDLKAFNAQTFGFDPVPETAPPARFC